MSTDFMNLGPGYDKIHKLQESYSKEKDPEKRHQIAEKIKELKKKYDIKGFSNEEFSYSIRNQEVLELGMIATAACREVLGQNNCKLITRIIDDDGKADVDIGRNITDFNPSPNTDGFYDDYSTYKRYKSINIGRVVVSAGWYEIEGNTGNYQKNFSNTFEFRNSLKKHLKDCFRL